MHRWHRISVVAVAGLLVVATTSAAATGRGTTSRVSVSGAGVEANGFSGGPAPSADGRYVAFTSYASNLVPADGNDHQDVFVRDRRAGTTARVSVSSSGTEANDFSFQPAISADGRFVVFTSAASNLVPGDTNGSVDVFVRDRRTGATSRVNLSSTGGQADGSSYQPAISADGRFVAFISAASNLVPGDTNAAEDVFVRDRRAGTTARVNLSGAGDQAAGASFWVSISADGRYVAFDSYGANLVPGDTNDRQDVFVRDRRAGTTTRASVSSAGAQANGSSVRPAISADGRHVAFVSAASNLLPGDTNDADDVYVWDRRAGITSRASVSGTGVEANGFSGGPALSADGRYVAFDSDAGNLVSGDTNGVPDVFVRDRRAGTTTRASMSSAGVQANDLSYLAAISADGRCVGFTSAGSNLVPGDTNGLEDVFARCRRR